MATAADLIDSATVLLGDPGNDVWGRTELLGYLNDGLKVVATKVPDQFTATIVVTLASGPKQTLPAGVDRMIMPVCNIDNAETTRGRAVRMIDKWMLDAQSPGWMGSTPGTTREVAYRPEVPHEFWVSPPANGGSKLEVQVAKDPTVHSQGTVVEVDAVYHPALIDYMVYRALSKDVEYAADGKAASFYQSFMNHFAGGGGESQ